MYGVTSVFLLYPKQLLLEADELPTTSYTTPLTSLTSLTATDIPSNPALYLPDYTRPVTTSINKTTILPSATITTSTYRPVSINKPNSSQTLCFEQQTLYTTTSYAQTNIELIVINNYSHTLKTEQCVQTRIMLNTYLYLNHCQQTVKYS